MKKLISTLLLLTLLLGACNNDVIEMYPPYIFFSNDVDFYVMNMDQDNPAPYTIKGSISAEGYLEEFQINDLKIGKDSIGDEKNWMFEHEVNLTGRTGPFEIPFRLTDGVGNSTTHTFRFLESGPIESYRITLGAQNNSSYGFFFSFRDRKVYSLAEFEGMLDEEGLCFGYSTLKNEPMLLAPTQLTNQVVVSNMKGNRVSSFCEIVAIDNITFDKIEFDKVQNDALMRNMNGVEFGTFAFTLVEEDKTYLFKSEDGELRGLAYIVKLETGVAGYAEMIIKMQE